MVKTKIIEKNDRPIMSTSEGIDHLLKPKDRDMVANVLRNLYANRIKTYITGGVLTDHLFDGKTDYNDIDIVGVIRKKDLYTNNSATNLVKELISANRAYKSLKLDSYPVSEFGDKMREDDTELKIFKSIAGEDFQIIGNYGGELTYVGLPIDERFTLRPERNSISRGLETLANKHLQNRFKKLLEKADLDNATTLNDYNDDPENPDAKAWKSYQDFKDILERGNLLPWTKTDIDLNLISEQAFEEGDIFTPLDLSEVVQFGDKAQSKINLRDSGNGQ